MFAATRLVRRSAFFAAGALTLLATPAAAQVRTLTACTPDALGVCTELRFGAVGGFFQLGVRAIGSVAQPSLPVAMYNLVLGTGADAVGLPADWFLPPVGAGGAVVSDASDWELFDGGDVLFLSALTNRGVGGCATGADVDGFGQAVTTCGSGQFATFTFQPTRAFDVRRFTLLDIEVAGLGATAEGASCGGPAGECVITADVTTPEPATATLLAGGLLALLASAGALRRREG